MIKFTRFSTKQEALQVARFLEKQYPLMRGKWQVEPLDLIDRINRRFNEKIKDAYRKNKDHCIISLAEDVCGTFWGLFYFGRVNWYDIFVDEVRRGLKMVQMIPATMTVKMKNPQATFETLSHLQPNGQEMVIPKSDPVRPKKEEILEPSI